MQCVTKHGIYLIFYNNKALYNDGPFERYDISCSITVINHILPNTVWSGCVITPVDVRIGVAHLKSGKGLSPDHFIKVRIKVWDCVYICCVPSILS